MEKPQVDAELLERFHSLRHRYLVRILAFALLYVGAAGSACVLILYGPPYAFVLCVPHYLLAGAALHGISLFTHEGVHGTLSRNGLANRLLAAVCAWPVLQNFSAYRVLHLRHHNHLGQEGDPDHYPNYTRWTWLQFIMYWGRLLGGYPVYIVAIPCLGFRHGSRRDRLWILWEVCMLAALVALVLRSPIPWLFLLHGWLIPMVFINTIVNIRGMSQHTLLENSADPILGTRSILTNPLTRFFMCNENYHLEHHLYPGVPWYHLERLHRELRPGLQARGAPFISSYGAFVLEFVVGSWRRRPWKRDE